MTDEPELTLDDIPPKIRRDAQRCGQRAYEETIRDYDDRLAPLRREANAWLAARRAEADATLKDAERTARRTYDYAVERARREHSAEMEPHLQQMAVFDRQARKWLHKARLVAAEARRHCTAFYVRGYRNRQAGLDAVDAEFAAVQSADLETALTFDRIEAELRSLADRPDPPQPWPLR